jgi:phosphoglycolate phosphatase-like HAD superfamily hydrolase
MTKGFIFDWSGTLADNFSGFHWVCECMFKDLGGQPLTLEELRQNYVTPYMLFWNKYFPDLTKEKQDRMFANYFCQLEDSRLFPGVAEKIKQIYDNGHKVFVISSDPLKKLLPAIERSGLGSYFEQVIGEDEEKTGSAKSLVEKFGLDTRSSYFIGDCRGDIEAGKKANLKTVGLAWGFEPRNRLAEVSPDYLFDDISELKNLI